MTGEQASALNDYLQAQRDRSFFLGVHDCFTFTNGAWAAMYGKPYAPELLGVHHTLGPRALADTLKRTYGRLDFLACLDAKMRRVDGIPPRGSLVVVRSDRYFLSHAFGIASGVTAAFVGDVGLVYKSIKEIDGAWIDG
jgi:hypothetical protein